MLGMLSFALCYISATAILSFVSPSRGQRWDISLTCLFASAQCFNSGKSIHPILRLFKGLFTNAPSSRSIYLDTEEKRVWMAKTDYEKLVALLVERRHLWLTVELLLLILATSIFAYWRVQQLGRDGVVFPPDLASVISQSFAQMLPLQYSSLR